MYEQSVEIIAFLDALHPSQHFFSDVGMFPGLNQYKAGVLKIKVNPYFLDQGHNTGPPVRLNPRPLVHKLLTLTPSDCTPPALK